MTIKFALWTLLLYEIITITSPSIVGVTYRDNFDFEQRFRDVNECNPFHWHPLHLPDYCADLYEQLIRSRLGNRMPLRVMVERNEHPESEHGYSVPYYSHNLPQNPTTIQFSHYGSPNVGQPHWAQMAYHFNEQQTVNDNSGTSDEYSESSDDYSESSDYEENNYSLEKPDYQRVLEQLTKDIAKYPSEGKVGVVPNVGPALIYKQEVSKKSEDMIKDLGTNYAKALEKMYTNHIKSENSKLNNPQIYVWDSRKNMTRKIGKYKKKKNKRRFSKKRIENNGLVTIIETLSPKTQRRRRAALYFYES